MADRWYYAHGTHKSGPCSARQLRDLADSGDILPTDTVWKEGVENGVLARKVKNLFLPAVGPGAEMPLAPQPAGSTATSAGLPPAAPSASATPPPSAPPAPAELRGAAPAESAPAQPDTRARAAERGPHQNQPRKGVAMAVRGAVIVGQDGFNVKYKKKCTVCGHADSFSHTMPIRNGSSKAAFFCPKCRKNRDVEIKGSLS